MHADVVKDLQCLGDVTKSMNEIEEAATRFILAEYGMSHCQTLTEARVISWKRKMERNVLEPPKLKSLPPTLAAFQENVKRAPLAVATMKYSFNPYPHPSSVMIMTGISQKGLIFCYQSSLQRERRWPRS